MAVIKVREQNKKSDGTYNTIHRETSADMVLMSDGSSLTTKITQAMPVGSIILWPLSTAPIGWILANGATNLSRATYPDLYNLYGTTFGYSDSTHFGVPDMRGLVPVGYKSGDANFGMLNGTGGEKTNTLTVDNIPPHNHPVRDGYGNYMDVNSGNWIPGQSLTANNGGSPSNPVVTTNTGGGAAHNNIQPYRAVNFIIKY